MSNFVKICVVAALVLVLAFKLVGPNTDDVRAQKPLKAG